MLGYPREAVAGRSGPVAARACTPTTATGVLPRPSGRPSRPDDFALSYRVRAADGRLVWLHHLGHVAVDDAGRAAGACTPCSSTSPPQRRREQAARLLRRGRAARWPAPGPLAERLRAVVELLGRRASATGPAVWLRDDDGRHEAVAAAPRRPRGARARPRPRHRAARGGGRVPGRPAVRRPRGHRGDAAGRRPTTRSTSRPLRPRRTGQRAGRPADGRAGSVTGLLSLASADGGPGPRRRHAGARRRRSGHGSPRRSPPSAVALRQHRLHEITVALSAAGTVAEAAAELADGVHRLLGASVVTVCRVVGGDLLQLGPRRSATRSDAAGALRRRCRSPRPPRDRRRRAPAGRCGSSTATAWAGALPARGAQPPPGDAGGRRAAAARRRAGGRARSRVSFRRTARLRAGRALLPAHPGLPGRGGVRAGGAGRRAARDRRDAPAQPPAASAAPARRPRGQRAVPARRARHPGRRRLVRRAAPRRRRGSRSWWATSWARARPRPR